MKQLINKCLSWIMEIEKDKVMHLFVGALVASIMCMAFCWIPVWANLLISAVITVGLAFLKELWLDYSFDAWDFSCTVVGGLLV